MTIIEALKLLDKASMLDKDGKEKEALEVYQLVNSLSDSLDKNADYIKFVSNINIIEISKRIDFYVYFKEIKEACERMLDIDYTNSIILDELNKSGVSIDKLKTDLNATKQATEFIERITS